jgi:hypothetical protein
LTAGRPRVNSETGEPTRVAVGMIRTLGGIVGGIACAIILMMVIEAIGNQVFPPPAGFDFTNPDAQQYLPFRTLAFPVVGWFAATLAGGWVAICVAEKAWPSWAVAAAVLLGEIANFLLGRHPIWMVAAGIALPLLAAWIAQQLPRRRVL